MPWYSFMALWPDGRSSLADAMRLTDDSHARHHAGRIVQELKEHPDYSEPGLKVVVLDDKGNTIHIIRF